MSAALAASTVTPGSTPPEESRTVPVNEACANAVAGIRISTSIARHFAGLHIRNLPSAIQSQEGGLGRSNPACRQHVRCMPRIAACMGRGQEKYAGICWKVDNSGGCEPGAYTGTWKTAFRLLLHDKLC